MYRTRILTTYEKIFVTKYDSFRLSVPARKAGGDWKIFAKISEK